MRKTNLGVALACTGLLTGLALPAAAGEQNWQLRQLTCDGQPVTTYMTFGGPFTSFHAVDSTDVIIPKHVEIYGYFGDFWKETMDVSGFDVNAVETVHCEYVDSRNYPVRFDGVRT
jgi:hypothetical protein